MLCFVECWKKLIIDELRVVVFENVVVVLIFGCGDNFIVFKLGIFKYKYSVIVFICFCWLFLKNGKVFNKMWFWWEKVIFVVVWCFYECFVFLNFLYVLVGELWDKGLDGLLCFWKLVVIFGEVVVVDLWCVIFGIIKIVDRKLLNYVDLRVRVGVFFRKVKY